MWRGPQWPLRYAFASLIVVLTIATLILSGLGQGLAGLLFFAVVVAAWYGGIGPGLYATMLTVAIMTAIFLAAGERIPPAQILAFVVFVALGVVISLIVESLHASRRRVEASQKWLSAVLTSIGDAVIATDREGGVVFMNPIAEGLTGWTQPDATGQPLQNVFQIYSETTRGPVENPIERSLRDGVIVGLANHTLLLSRDGTERPIDDSAAPIRDGAGETIGAVLVFRDVSEPKKAERRQALLAEAGRLLGSSLDYESTLAGVCELIVPAFADCCHLDLVDQDGEIGRLTVVHKDDAQVVRLQEIRRLFPPRKDDPGGLTTVLRTGEPVFNFALSDDDLGQVAMSPEHLERLRALEVRSVIIVPLTARGRTIGAMTLLTVQSSRRFVEKDVRTAVELGSRAAMAVDNARLFQEREQAARRREEALSMHRSIEEQLTLLVEASGSLSESLDLASVLTAILDLSRRLIAADGYAIWRLDAATGHWKIGLASGLSLEYQRSTIRVTKETPRMPNTAIIAEDVLAVPQLGEREKAYEREGIRSLLAVPLKGRGQADGSLVFYYRTPHRFSEVEVRVATALSNLAASAISNSDLYERLKENDRRKDEFLAMLAHELRNPLAAVKNAVAVLGKSKDDDDRLWAGDVVERQVKQLTRLIDDLLDVSRINSGKIRLRRDHVDAASVLDDAVETARPLIDERNHELAVSVDRGNLPIWADTTRLEQIVVNLLTNAAKYTDPGGRIWLDAARDGQHAVFTVRDTGIGIPPEKLPEMFTLFTQGERSIARSEGGLGIGLTIVQKLTEMHSGSVTATSRGPGQGSEFTVRIPLVQKPKEGRAEVNPSPGGRKERSRILVVDDNEDTARGMVRLLKMLGNEVVVAHDGHSAVSLARDFRPEFILLDIGLPGMDGYEVAETLRQEADFQKTTIIGVSGYGQEEDRRRSRAAGFHHHLVKPVDLDKLIGLIKGPAA